MTQSPFVAPNGSVPVSEVERIHLLRLARTDHVGPISFHHLMQRFGSAQEALDRLPSITRRTTLTIPTMDDAKREIDAHHAMGLSLVCRYESQYPLALRSLKDAPSFLSAKGKLDLVNQTTMAIVGARQASQAGERMAQSISEGLSCQKWVTVSGLARGIDTCVHQASVHDGGTIAVIAGGIGHIYPPENKDLYAEIAEKGLILSEDSVYTAPQASLFPKRNRIISGLAWGCLIIEASLRSGSLLTAKYAADQGRTVMAVPGHPLDFRAKGGNKLLKQGACLIESVDDVINEYQSTHPYKAFEQEEEPYEPMPPLLTESSTLAADILSVLNNVPISIADLAFRLKISPVLIRVALIDMELNGEIERYPGDAVYRLL